MNWLGRKHEADDPMALADAAASRGDYAEALSIWGPLAHAGNMTAQNNIGACFLGGSASSAIPASR